MLDMDDEDWAELEDSSAARPKSTASSHISACGPPTTLDPVSKHHAAPAVRRTSNVDIKVMRPAPKLQRRTLTAATRQEEAVQVEAPVGAAGEPATEAKVTSPLGQRLTSSMV
jgi:hypothetical protein